MIKSDFKNSHSNISMTNTSQCAMLKKSKSCISWSLSQLPPCSRLDLCSQEICHSGHCYFKGRSLQQQPSFKLKTRRLEWKKKKKQIKNTFSLRFQKTFWKRSHSAELFQAWKTTWDNVHFVKHSRESFPHVKVSDWEENGVKAMTRRNER